MRQLIILFAAMTWVSWSGPAIAQISSDPAIAAAMRDMCGRDIVLLGEHGGHGNGRTIEVKAEIVRTLIDRCGFDTVLWEGSYYDFAELRRRMRAGEPTSRDLLASAVGGLWNRFAEIQPLIDFLYDRARGGRLFLGGIDDQLGSFGMFYSIRTMAADLAATLSENRRAACQVLMHRRIYWGGSSDNSYDPAAREQLQLCLAEVRTALVALGESGRDRLPLIDNFERLIARDFGLDAPAQMAGRDAAMARNIVALRAAAGRRAKVIVWAATIHVARDASASPLLAGRDNMGAPIARMLGRRAFVLGFGAVRGGYRLGRQLHSAPPVAPDSLEARALAGTSADAVYLDRRSLGAMGEVNASLFSRGEPLRTRWSHVIDGVIVFRNERPPTLSTAVR